MGVGTGGQEITTTWISLPFLARNRRIILHITPLQHCTGGVRGAVIKGKRKGVRVGAGRGWGAGQHQHWSGGDEPKKRQLTGAIKSCKALGKLAQILQKQREVLDHIHVSAAWGCLVRIGRGRGAGEVRDVVAVLQDRTRDVLEKMDGRGIANVMHSISKLHPMWVPGDRGLLEAMQMRAMATAGEFKPQEVANLLWALATMGEGVDRGLLEVMQGRATATAGECNPQDVAN
ncbi:hypothetical protein T484DRAFT_1831139, partial [Baffinella frigidus]